MSIEVNEDVLTQCFIALENCPHQPRGVVSAATESVAEDDESEAELCPCLARFDLEILRDILAGRAEEFPELARATERLGDPIEKTDKIYCIKVILMVFHERDYFVMADSAEQALEKHAHGESVFSADGEVEFEDELRAAEGDDEIVEEVLEITDEADLEDARQLITEED